MASCCARLPCPSPPSAHQHARVSRLTHRPRRPAPRHRIRHREHASLSMSPVRAGGELVSTLARARRGLGSAGRGRGAPAAGCDIQTVGWSGSGAGPACCGCRRAGQAAAGGVACLGRARRGSLPEQGGRAGACSAHPRRPRAAAVVTVRRRGRRRSCWRSLAAPPPSPPRRCPSAAGACDASAGGGPLLGGIPREPYAGS
jgi:hypothetical protein